MCAQFNHLQAITIGATARRLLKKAAPAKILGTTSHGLYMLTGTEWVVFLTHESWRGPLTINVDGDCFPPSTVSKNEPIEVTPEVVSFPNHGLHIDLSKALTWQAPPIPDRTTPKPQQMLSIKQVIRSAIAAGNGSGYQPWMAGILDPAQVIHAGEEPPIRAWLDRVKLSTESRSSKHIADSLLPFLGHGQGLTPSGDDFVLGYLLAMNRWGRLLAFDFPSETVNQLIQPAFRDRTNTLSASLLECAADAQGDERLVAAADALVRGSDDTNAAIEDLATWGHSSGFDALLGMVAFICATEISEKNYSK